jgi:hypothetical protein
MRAHCTACASQQQSSSDELHTAILNNCAYYCAVSHCQHVPLSVLLSVLLQPQGYTLNMLYANCVRHYLLALQGYCTIN